MIRLLALAPLLLLAACASAPTRSGFLSTYDGLTPRTDTVRAKVEQRRDEASLAQVRQVAIEPTVILNPGGWLTPGERVLLLRELDAQLCFELSERFDIDPAAPNKVRVAITRVDPTGRAASVASAAAGFFIPGPLGLRAPGTLGALSAEAEMLREDRQIVAISWSRGATAIGTDDPSLSRVGDALQFAEPFADAVAAAMTPEGLKSRPIPRPDPCAEFGARFRPEGWAAKFATGLYVPEMSGAKADKKDR
ncbi:hypothetical protein ASE17_16175 [Phenylobacterium sp. Root77]|uniref:DUF3313 family protein n=1 Tax=unclassified Phenylobacterium TaxID=2640670 RepID=UPI000700267E|nr:MULTISPECIES: DUF3313 family protein [unclassified Phenylobacterium]KQW70430.1 hypothetical protein ASC73_10055 [Phenylobacterium sp. Root1277]KQW91149.1 hypothetical protein ASC79_17535 [Phenylobacterium sp. Root1290]KRC39215.1 hypothetical protein ASE17_16175 [Phenylobacterium sp. Root77]